MLFRNNNLTISSSFLLSTLILNMDDQFVNWEDLDLDNLLGEYTEDEDFEVETDASEIDEEYDNGDVCDIADPESESENKKPQPKSKKAKTNEKVYSCPMCSKEYKSASGFRGHVSNKHNKPELKGKIRNDVQ